MQLNIFILLVPLLHLLISRKVNANTRKISITIPEQQQIGVHVANIIDVAELDSLMSSMERQGAKFQYFSSSPAERFFALHSKTGDLTIRRPIDRDNLCDTVTTCCPQRDRAVDSCVLNLSIRSDDEYRYVVLAKIIVTDINDNSPAWSESELTVHFSEASAVGEMRSLKVAKDPDSGDFSVVRYEMQPPMSQFKLQVYKSKTPLAINSQLKLKLTSPLDREKNSSYTFHLRAFDGGNPARTGTVKVSVFVTDENDNKPIFEKSLYIAHLDENTKRHSPVIEVEAKDRDSGANGQVRYSFSTLTKAAYRRAFVIDALSGIIRVQGLIDYERFHEMTLYVEAVDQGLASRTGMTTVSVRIHDENDHQPRIKLESSSSGRLAHVLEEQVPPSLLAVFSVEDSDSGPNGQIVCQAIDPAKKRGHDRATAAYGLEKMNIPDTDMYKVLALTKVDREITPRLLLGVECADLGRPALTTTATLSVTVDDINDHDPDFGHDVIHREVREDKRPGETLFLVNATDLDENENGRLDYWLEQAHPGPTSPFSIDRTTGRVSLQQNLDRESVDRLSFVVFAKDNGKPEGRTASATVSVRVLDANDNRPQLDNVIYVTVPENATPGGEPLTQINATDADLDQNAKMRYSMEPLSQLFPDEIGLFHLSHDGKLVLVLKGLDREKRAEYDFLVRVTNEAPPALTSTSTLIITVADINDCQPEFIFPSAGNDTVTIWSSQRAGQTVAKVIAKDGDINSNGRVNYFIRPPGVSAAAQTIESLFNLDSNSGEMTLKRDLRRSDMRQYHVLLEVRDNGHPQKSNIAVLKIRVFMGTPGVHAGPGQVTIRGRSNDNFIIIIILVSVTGVCASILIVAILALLYRRKKGPIKEGRHCLAGGQHNLEDRSKWRMDIMHGHQYASTVDSHGSVTEEHEPLTRHIAMDGISPTYVSFINQDQLSLTSFDNSNDSGKGGSVDNNCQATFKDDGACHMKSAGILKLQTFKDSSDHSEANSRAVDVTVNLLRSSEQAHPILYSPSTVSRGYKSETEAEVYAQRTFRNSATNLRSNRELSPICEQPCLNIDATRLDTMRHMNGYHTIDCARRAAQTRTEHASHESPELSASFV